MSITGFSSSPSGLMRRREARRIAMTFIYATECTSYHLDEAIALIRNVRADWNEPPEFALRLAHAVQRNHQEIETAVESVLENWRLNRIAPIERAILMLGTAEILYFPEIPPRVTINEYIELAKTFSNENAPPFVNGILDKLVHKIGKPDNLKKPNP